MPDDSHLSLADLMSYAQPHLSNGHNEKLEYALRHATTIPTLIRHGKIALARQYLENAKKYSQFTTGQVAELDGYLAALEEEIAIAERRR